MISSRGDVRMCRGGKVPRVDVESKITSLDLAPWGNFVVSRLLGSRRLTHFLRSCCRVILYSKTNGDIFIYLSYNLIRGLFECFVVY